MSFARKLARRDAPGNPRFRAIKDHSVSQITTKYNATPPRAARKIEAANAAKKAGAQ